LIEKTREKERETKHTYKQKEKKKGYIAIKWKKNGD
jgi:hypothetical protein